MAIDRTGISSLNAGAPEITYSGNEDTITVTITDTDSAVFNLFVTKAISAKGTSELLSQPLVVAESEIIKVTAATANRLHVILSALEIKPRVVTS